MRYERPMIFVLIPRHSLYCQKTRSELLGLYVLSASQNWSLTDSQTFHKRFSSPFDYTIPVLSH